MPPAGDEDSDATMTFRSSRAALAAAKVEHVLILAEPGQPVDGERRLLARRYSLGATPLRIGRTAGNDLVLATPEVSRSHCMVVVEPGRGAVITDLGSTNGTFVDGRRVTAPTLLTDHALIAVGSHTLLHRSGTAEQIARAATLEQEMERAVRYVRAVLPEPIREGPIRADWRFLPSERLGGDGFGYHRLRDGRFAVWLLDVVGHGIGSALLAVSVMNLLRQSELPGADPGEPAQVLLTLNALFPMDRHGGLCFSAWYGVFDPASRTLHHAAGGQHPALLVAPGEAPRPLAARNMLLGSVPDIAFRSAVDAVPAGSRLYLFSDGAFEVVGVDGTQRGLSEFTAMVAAGPDPGRPEPDRLLHEADAAKGPAPFEDDVSLLVLEFD
ncbi:MAG: SpoIIE family protein phosphatase [Acetobacteraceae bacterium]|nr:SpoIIE family protein phosphatase [Acetobacteraceae bacterium]